MTDKNRQKGNESVGEKSDGLAGDGREAFRNAERDAYLMMMLRKHISPVAVDYVSLGDVPTEGMKRFARGLQNDARTQGFEDCINAIRGAIAFGQQNANVPPAGNWLTEFWEIGQKLARPAPEALPSATKRLIGWRTDNYLWETSDPEMAKNWEPHHTILPIFEGDPHTKLPAPEALGAAKGVSIDGDEVFAAMYKRDPYWDTQGRSSAEAVRLALDCVRSILGAAKGELSDAEIMSIAYDCNAMPECITDASLKAFARAILAKAKGEQV
ncbi:hypothetical protein [Cupriavidus metallidurans]|uniref:hypothetical protein n=1 Tax=Cupriavidus metallidurans TaxID=119219 RepID=UPI001646FCD5|nr:hypothetical protein [Cupriavidus metallidurans]